MHTYTIKIPKINYQMTRCVVIIAASEKQCVRFSVESNQRPKIVFVGFPLSTRF